MMARNLLVKFSGTKTRIRQHRLTAEKNQSNSSKMGILINHVTLYLLFQKEYNMMYKEDGSPFTAYQSIQTWEDKKAIFSNFFKFDVINEIMAERQLAFKFSFFFKYRYNLHFLVNWTT